MASARQRKGRGWSGLGGEKGGVALEYVLVTTFAAILGVSLLGLAANVFKHKLEGLAEQAGLELDEVRWNPFAED